MAFFHGKHENCWWAYFHGKLAESDWPDFLAFSEEAYTHAKPGDLLITMPISSDPPKAPQRAAIAELVRTSEGVKNISHHAFITDSKMLFAVNTAITWMSNKPFRERTFTNPDEAFEWLHREGNLRSPADLKEAIASTIPAVHLWNALRTRQKESA